MKESMASLERKLNEIIDNELKKDTSQIDDRLVMECCDGLLRMDNTARYMISKSEMRNSIDTVVGKKSRHITKMKKSVKVLLIAAIIAIMLAVGSLGYAQYKYNIFNFSDHATVMFSGVNKRRVGNLEMSFIPNGFVLNYESNNKYECSREYFKGNNFFVVSKQTSIDKIDIDTEHGGAKVTQLNGIDYIEYGEADSGMGIVWEQDGFKYTVTGNISRNVLFKIAISIGNS